MKKVGMMLLAVIMLLALCACAGNETENTVSTPMCQHDYTSKVTKQASCKEEGKITYTCSKCGDSYTEKTAKEEHSYKSKLSKMATCQEEGELLYVCENCGDTYREAIPVTDHEFSHASCSEPKTCVNCGLIEGTPLEHKYEDGICKGCAQTDPKVKVQTFGGNWVGYIPFNDGQYYVGLQLSNDYGLFYGFFFPVEYETEEQLQKILNDGIYPHIKEFGGKYYYSEGGGGANDFGMVKIGSTSTVYAIIHDELGVAGIMKFAIDSDSQLVLKEASGDFFDEPEANYGNVIFYTGYYGD